MYLAESAINCLFCLARPPWTRLLTCLSLYQVQRVKAFLAELTIEGPFWSTLSSTWLVWVKGRKRGKGEWEGSMNRGAVTTLFPLVRFAMDIPWRLWAAAWGHRDTLLVPPVVVWISTTTTVGQIDSPQFSVNLFAAAAAAHPVLRAWWHISQLLLTTPWVCKCLPALCLLVLHFHADKFNSNWPLFLSPPPQASFKLLAKKWVVFCCCCCLVVLPLEEWGQGGTGPFPVNYPKYAPLVW